ncbi:Piso0_002045 [Millerozyma farinosa CBS 7064]|nr:Piso0_002045 [Millerozyma farinosa CBS 7064]
MERRVFSPFGMNGGYPGRKGYNYWLRKQADGSFRKVSLGGKNSVWISSGDRVRIETPSGGGWGVPHEEKSENSPIEKNDVSYAPAELVSEPSEVFTGSVALRHLQQISA